MVIPFAPWHADMMPLNRARRREVVRYLGALEKLGDAGWVRTIVAERGDRVDVLGVAGVAPLEGGDGEVFVIMAENAPRLGFVKGVRQLLEQAKGHFATIRALGDEGDGKIERWLSWLGFQQVGSEFSRVVEGKRMIVWELC